ncbi:ribonuclease III [Dothidotthia symphoricarpi CBS 119687]|uniref:Ribonuclease III n=1 Tax=Dothidotthia symphoricarpi CBS 119687 TaxID=1392245 RepID=A0A6A6A1Q1_9PLEO|nr:ribonuclease III [Dothidotthia symphoricarpi CBS 119687]KAF2124491.1 ribonuclease III [Dothidotthia symphoricarpi CBS 119687]
MPMLNTGDKAAQIEEMIGYTFNNKLFAAEAVQMAAPQTAVIHEGMFFGLENNKRLSLLGDAVLAKVLCDKWFHARDNRGHARSLSDWTTARNDLLSNDALAQRGYDLGVDGCVILSPGMHTVSRKMVASSVEAIVGAVYRDGGDSAVLCVIEKLGFFDHRLLLVMFSLLHSTT